MKKNFVLVLGVSLPILLIIAFMVAQGLTKLVDPPEYTAVFAVQNKYGGSRGMEFKVDGQGRLSINVPAFSPWNNNKIIPTAIIYIFNPKTNKVENIAISPPEAYEVGQEFSLEVPEELTSLYLIPDPIAPDGYVLEPNNRSRGNLFTEIFGYRNRNYSRYILFKDMRKVPIPNQDMIYGEMVFIGWVEDEGPRQ